MDPIQQHLMYVLVSDLTALSPNLAMLIVSPTLRELVFPTQVYIEFGRIYKIFSGSAVSAMNLASNEAVDEQTPQVSQEVTLV